MESLHFQMKGGLNFLLIPTRIFSELAKAPTEKKPGLKGNFILSNYESTFLKEVMFKTKRYNTIKSYTEVTLVHLHNFLMVGQF